ncbi:MAG: P-loop NTPase, partial [Brevundimonas sp.]|nr:P-loop NTPase [Brevundimonas sp.]
VFGRGGGKAEAARLEIPYLGDLPLDAAVREGGDAGVPVVVSDPDGEVAARFAGFAEALAKKLDLKGFQTQP